MSFDARRGVVVALGLLAVALGGALFPAAGVGSVPGGGPVESGPGSGPGPAEQTGTADSTVTPGSSATPGPEETSTDGPTATATPTPTATASPTRASPSPPSQTPSDGTQTPTRTQSSTATPTTWTETPSVGGTLPFSPYTEVLLWIGLGLAAVGGITALVTVLGSSEETPTGGPPVPVQTIDSVVEDAVGIVPSRVVARVPQVTMVVLVSFSTSTAKVLQASGSLLRDGSAALGAVLGGSWTMTAGLFGGLGNLLASPPSVSGSLVSVPGLLGALTTSGVRDDAVDTPVSDARGMAEADPPDPDEESAPTTIEDAWARFADDLPVRDPETMTAGESARAAVEAGYPPEPVHRLTRIFESVRYGGASRTRDRIDAALAAARAIEDHREDHDE